MSISSQHLEQDKKIVIDIKGRFDFSMQKEFREAYRNHDPYLLYIVNLTQTEYMDSSALGMLLLLRQHAGEKSDRVVLRGAGEAVRKILDIANFGKLFVIE